MDYDQRVQRDANIESKAHEVKQCIVNDGWWDNLDCFLYYTKPILNMLQVVDSNTFVLHLIYDMWNVMIESVKKIIFDHEGKNLIGASSIFFDVVHQILTHFYIV